MLKKTALSPLILSKSAYKDALRHALSFNEVGLLFFGKGKQITKVIRIENVHKEKRNRFLWNDDAYRNAVEYGSKRGLELIAEGHSHSKKTHLKRPSKNDLMYFKNGLHIIVFPDAPYIGCWLLKNSYASKKDIKIY